MTDRRKGVKNLGIILIVFSRTQALASLLSRSFDVKDVLKNAKKKQKSAGDLYKINNIYSELELVPLH